MALTKITPQMFDTSAAGHDFNIDNGTFVVDASANRVGIGATNPNTNLQLYHATDDISINVNHGTGGSYPKKSGISFGAISTSLGGDATFTGGAGIQVTNTAATNNPTEMAFFTTSGGAPTTRMLINSDGEVGIGETNPQFPLHVKSSSTDVTKFETSGSYTFTRFSSSSRNWAISAGSSFGIYDETASQTRLTIDASGNLSNIGTISSGNISVTGQGDFSTLVYVGNNNSAFAENNLLFQSPGAAYIDHATTGQHIYFRTSVSSSRDTTPLQVGGDGYVYIRGLRLSGADGSVNQIWQSTSNAMLGLSANGGDINFGQTSASIMRLKPGGNVGIGDTDPVSLKSAITLQVNGNIKLGNNNARGLIGFGDVDSTGSNVAIWRGAAGAYAGVGNYLNLGGYDGITFTTGNAEIASQSERWRINSVGVLISGGQTPVSIGGTPADANSTEVGRGYINLARDDTADADQILFAKNGAIHSKLQTVNNAFVVHAEGTDIHFKTNQGGTARNINFSGSAPSLKPFDSNNGQIDLGTANAKFRSLYVNYLGPAADLRYLKGVFRKAVNVNKSFVAIFKVNGSALGSQFRFSVVGTTGNVVVNARYEILVNHSYDCTVQSLSGSYTETKVKIVSNANEDCTVYLAANTYNNATASLNFEVETYHDEQISFDVSSPHTTAHFIHTATAGENTTFTGAMTTGAGTTTGYS